MRLSPIPLCVAMVVAGSSVWFVVSTVVMDQIPDAALMAVALLVALAFVSAFAGTPLMDRVRVAGARETALAAAGGVLAWFVPFMLVLTQRATDAPSGTETLFFSTAGWVLTAVVVALAFREERPSFTLIAGSLLAILGGAALLANWERPSSFSPFMKFPAEESLMLVAGVVFALGLLLGRRSTRILGARTALWIGVASAALVAVVVAVPGGFGSSATVGRVWPQLLLLGVALATLAIGVSALTASRGIARAISWMALTPVALTGLSAIERLTGVFGPTPIVWLGATGGAVLACLGVLVMQTSSLLAEIPSSERRPARRASTLTFIVIAFAGASALSGAVSLFLPAFSASVTGMVESGAAFSASWTLIGVEAAVGWLPLCVGLLALAVVVDLRRADSITGRLVAAVSGVAAIAAYPLIVATPLHTWNRWIPAEIQQAYGTEYARLTLEVAPQVLRFAAAALALVACAALVVLIMLTRNADVAVQIFAPEESA